MEINVMTFIMIFLHNGQNIKGIIGKTYLQLKTEKLFRSKPFIKSFDTQNDDTVNREKFCIT